MEKWIALAAVQNIFTLLRHELEKLNLFCDSLDPAKGHPGNGMLAAGPSPSLAEIQAECLRVRQALTHSLFTKAPDDVLERYVQYHQMGITELADRLHAYRAITPRREEELAATSNFIPGLLGLLKFLQGFFSRYFNQEGKLPEALRLAALEELQPQILRLTGLVQGNVHAQCLKRSVLDYLYAFTSEKVPQQITYRGLSYLRHFLEELQQLFQQADNLEKGLSETLIRLNFNHLGLLAGFQQHLREELANAGSTRKQLDILSAAQQRIKNLQVKCGFSYDPSWPDIKVMLGAWLEEEIDLLAEPQHHITPRVADENGVPEEKLPVNLSVARLACLTRLLYEENFYATPSVTDILKFTARHFRSLRQQQISQGSLTKEYYGVTQVTAASILDLLERMIARINKQYFPVWVAIGATALCCS